MSNEIRIHLVSVLDDAGYNATNKKTKETAATVEKEIERMLKKRQEYERSAEGMAKKTIQQMDKQKSQVEALKNKIEELPGPIGKLASEWLKAHKGMAEFAGKSMAAVAAFKVGWDIGTWINEHVVEPLFKIKDPVEELKKANKRLAKSAEEEAKRWAAAQEELLFNFQKERDAINDTTSAIDRKTAAYLKLQDAVKSVGDAVNDNELLELERDKFHDMTVLKDTPEASAQIGKYYDVLIAQKKAAKAIEDLEHSQNKSAEQLDSDRTALANEQRAVRQLKAEEARLKSELQKVDDGRSLSKANAKEIAEAEAAIEKKIYATQRKLKEAQIAVEKRQEEIAVGELAQKELEWKRKNIEESTQLEIDRKKAEYDKYLDEVKEKEEKKAREDWEKKQKAIQDEEKARKEMADKVLQQEIHNLQKEMGERQRMLSEAENRLRSAQTASGTAWKWFRDKSSLKAFMEEKKADAEAEADYQRQFARLKSFRKDWRTANAYGSGGMRSLSLDEEAVRQVALTREAEADAQKAVTESRDALVWIREHLETVESMKE